MGQQRDISRRGSCGCRSQHVKDIYVYCRYVERTNLFAKAVNGVLRDMFLKKHDIQSRACSACDIFRPGSCGCRASTSRAATCTTSTEKAHNAADLMKTVNRVLRDMFLKKLVFRPVAESMKHENVLVS